MTSFEQIKTLTTKDRDDLRELCTEMENILYHVNYCLCDETELEEQWNAAQKAFKEIVENKPLTVSEM